MESAPTYSASETTMTEPRESGTSVSVIELLLDLSGDAEYSTSNTGLRSPSFLLTVSSPQSTVNTPWHGSDKRASQRHKKVQCVRFALDLPNINNNKEEAQLGHLDTSEQNEAEFHQTENLVRERFARDVVPLSLLPNIASPCTAPPRPIIVNQLPEEQVERSLQEQEMVSQHGERAIDYMKRGCLVYKYKHGVATKRFLSLNEQTMAIEWRELTRKEAVQFQAIEEAPEWDKPVEYSVKNSKLALFPKSSKSILLSNVAGLRFGPYGVTAFRKFTQKCNEQRAKSWHSMVIQGRQEALLLVFLTVRDLTAWALGLQLLSPNMTHPMTIGKLLWFRTLLKLYYIKFYRFNALPGADWSDLINAPGVIDHV